MKRITEYFDIVPSDNDPEIFYVLLKNIRIFDGHKILFDSVEIIEDNEGTSLDVKYSILDLNEDTIYQAVEIEFLDNMLSDIFMYLMELQLKNPEQKFIHIGKDDTKKPITE